MATRHTDRITLVAAADLSTKQNLFAIVSGSDGCNVAGAGGDAVGVILNKPTSGQPAEILVGPLVPITLAATLAAGAEVMSDASRQGRRVDHHEPLARLPDARRRLRRRRRPSLR
jgi:hypothetical protein